MAKAKAATKKPTAKKAAPKKAAAKISEKKKVDHQLEKNQLEFMIAAMRRRVEKMLSDPTAGPLVYDMIKAADGVASLLFHVAVNDPDTGKEAECVERELAELGIGFNLEEVREWAEQQ